MFNEWADFDELEVGFPEQCALFDLLTALNGAPPPVIDSDDMLEDPDAMIAAFCDAVGPPFIPEAMTWEPGGDSSAHHWWDGESLRATLAQSTRLTPQAPRYVALTDASEWVRRLHRRMQPHYNHF